MDNRLNQANIFPTKLASLQYNAEIMRAIIKAGHVIAKIMARYAGSLICARCRKGKNVKAMMTNMFIVYRHMWVMRIKYED
jgi:hypothetical protein